MNTPRKRKRYAFKMPSTGSGGEFTAGIFDDAFALWLGQLACAFSHLDEALGVLLHDLLGDAYKLPLREVYRSVVSPEARLAMLKNLLEKSEFNRDKSTWYDEVLQEFDALKLVRNNYLHGLWWTRHDGRAFIVKVLPDPLSRHDFCEVELATLQNAVERMWKLTFRILTRDGLPRPQATAAE